jgi:hypothetical protein
MKPVRHLFIATLLALPALVSAQYMWIDKDGRKVFSDRPPPQDTPAAKVLRQPAAAPAAPKGEGGDAAAPGAGATTAAATSPARPASGAVPQLGGGKDKGLEEKKKQQEAAEAEKKKADEAKFAALKLENCNRAKASKATLDSGIRVAQLNAKGEKEVMDDSQRGAEQKRLADVIARDCK